MTLAVCCLSHSPLIGKNDPPADITREVDEAIGQARRFVEEFDPELVVLFGPDHLNGFLYKVMPQFCVGTKATAIGDFGSPAGPLAVDATRALLCAEVIIDSGIDAAVSLDMTVDHAFAQPLSLVVGGLEAKPVIPIFINAAGPPRSGISRSRLLGAPWGSGPPVWAYGCWWWDRAACPMTRPGRRSRPTAPRRNTASCSASPTRRVSTAKRRSSMSPANMHGATALSWRWRPRSTTPSWSSCARGG